MKFDVAEHLDAAERSVAALDRDGRPARAVALSRGYAATPDGLWDAVACGERLARWFLPISGDLRPGGRYRLEGNAEGVIVACERPRRLALTWEFSGDVSWVDARWTRVGAGRARLALTHTQRPSSHWSQYGPGAAGVGWELAFLGLAFHIAQPDAPKLDAAAFAASRDGKAFVRGSCDGWERAAVAAGEDPAAATVQAVRTRAFYTGEPVDPSIER